MTLRDSLRKAILESGQSANSLAKALSIPQTTITRFLQGTDIRLSAVEKLAAYFRLELRPIDEPAPAESKTRASSKKRAAKKR